MPSPKSREESIAREFFARMNAKDTKILDLYAENAVFVSPDGERVQGKESLRGFFARTFARGPSPIVKSILIDGGTVAVVVESALGDGSHSRAVDLFEIGPDGIRSQSVYRQVVPS